MKAPLFDATGKSSGQADLEDSIFGLEPNLVLIQEIITAENTNRRQGTRKTKTVSEIRGGGRKPYRQKGTGNARQGSIRSTQFRGGSTIFGPLPQNFEIRIPAAKRKAALRSILSYKVSVNALSVIKDPDTGYSTKKANGILEAAGLIPGGTVTFITGSEQKELLKSIGNIALVKTVTATRLTAPELYYNSHVLITESALKELQQNLAAKGAAA